MCGIAGWIDWEKDLSAEGATVERMAETMRRRGPDDKGVWLSPRAALSHRRLSVIDPENGRQPMTFGSGREAVALVYNGELYNFEELRDELSAKGHQFRTRCDTEVVLHAYLEWGIDCVPRFDGIFAFAVWDERSQRLFMARDRLGVKPLYWTQNGTTLLFASEIKALLTHPSVKAEVDQDGLTELFIAPPPSIVSTPGKTPFRGILELRPGRHLVFERDRTAEGIYWQRVSQPHTDDVDQTVERIRDLLQGAVKRQLVADVPLACLLSGGVDSSAITAIAGRYLNGAKPQSWSIDFVDHERDYVKASFLSSRDAPFAAEAAGFIGAEHHPVVLDVDEMVESSLDVMRARDLPIGTQLDTSLLLLFRALKKKATVALSGEAADEVFGGYPWFWGDPANAPAFPWIEANFPFGVSAELMARIRPHEYIQARYEEALLEVPRLPGESAAEAKWKQNIYFGQTRWLPYLLSRKDSIGMYASVEGRVPFCDHRLVEYMWNVPSSLARVDGVEKSLLRRAVTGLLPDAVLNRKKSAFPHFEHPVYVQGVRDRARDLLANPNSPAIPLFDVAHLQRRCENAPGLGGTYRDTRTPSESVLILEKFIQTNAWLQEYRISLV